MNYPAYSEYKESRVEWLGMVPAHWQISRLKNYVRMRYGDALTSDIRESGDISVFGSNGPVGTHARPNTSAPAIVVGRKGSYGKIVWAESGGFVIDTAYTIDKTETTQNIRWLYFILQILDLDTLSQDTGVPGLSREKAYQLHINIPSKNEQQAIANFLDRETARIDQLIAEKQNFIKLLKEKRQALISHVVTKGLNPNVKMKDSGIEWIGDIPADWLVTRLKFLVSNIIDTEHKTIPFVDNSDFYVARTSDIKDAELILTNCKRTDVDSFSEWTKRGVPTSGDMILTREAPAGEACIVPNDYNICLGQRTVLIKFNNKLLAEYFLLVIYSDLTKEFIENASMGSTVKHLNMSDIPNIPVFCPDIETQKLIVDEAGKEISKLKLLEKLTIESIDLLKEHRTSLISAAVTGKVDVRHFKEEAA